LRVARRRPEVRWSDLTRDEQRAAEALLQPANPEPAVAPVDETQHLLDSLLNALAPEDRMVITLLHLEERSVAEIAGLTGWSRVVVRMRAYRARRRRRSLVARLGTERR
jgi:DNA-directed RNA polymerase specialized sigma24 family protein